MESNLSTGQTDDYGEPADTRVRAVRRRNLLEAAERLFLRDGYRHATMERVADEAGVSKQTLYNYFSDKEELFAALLQLRQGEQLLVEIEAALSGDAAENPEQALQSAAEALFRYASDPQFAALHRVMIELLGEQPDLVDRVRQRFFLHNIEIVRRALERGAAAGTLRDVDAEAVAYCLFAIASSYALFRPTLTEAHAKRLSPERMARALAQM